MADETAIDVRAFEDEKTPPCSWSEAANGKKQTTFEDEDSISRMEYVNRVANLP